MHKYLIFLLCCLGGLTRVYAHPMPTSVMLLDVKKHGIAVELQWPLKELQAVFPTEDIDSNYTTLIDRKKGWLQRYLLQHFTVADNADNYWQIDIKQLSVSNSEQAATGSYHELNFQLWLQPPAGVSTRQFVMHYDAIMHQLVTHKMLIRISSDWYGGLTAKDSANADLGVLAVNTIDGSIPPVKVNLDEGSTWKGFATMVKLGIEHISEGTDHLLFLIVLLLPATLIVKDGKWSQYGGFKYSSLRLLKIVTAFTIGHSLSLFLGAMKWMTLPQQPVEIAIAFTILVTAIHAIRPLFFGKETFIAAAFGLIHGLAFSTVLAGLHVDSNTIILSILGFNSGIELMQLFVILCIMPWLFVLSKNKFYQWVRITGALLAIIASLGWILERISNEPNVVSNIVQRIADEGKWLAAGLAVLATISSIFSRSRRSLETTNLSGS